MPSVALLLKTLTKNAKKAKGKNITKNLSEINDLNAVSGLEPLKKSSYIDDDLYAELIRRNTGKYDTLTKPQDIDLEEWADDILENAGYKPEDLTEYPIRTNEEEEVINNSLRDDLLNILEDRPLPKEEEIQEFPVIDRTEEWNKTLINKKRVSRLKHTEDPMVRDELIRAIIQDLPEDIKSDYITTLGTLDEGDNMIEILSGNINDKDKIKQTIQNNISQDLFNEVNNSYKNFREPMKKSHKPKGYFNSKRTNMDQPNINDEGFGYFDEENFNPGEIPVGTQLNPQEISSIEMTLQGPNVTDKYDREYLRHLVKLLRGSNDFNF